MISSLFIILFCGFVLTSNGLQGPVYGRRDPPPTTPEPTEPSDKSTRIYLVKNILYGVAGFVGFVLFMLLCKSQCECIRDCLRNKWCWPCLCSKKNTIRVEPIELENSNVESTIDNDVCINMEEIPPEYNLIATSVLLQPNYVPPPPYVQ